MKHCRCAVAAMVWMAFGLKGSVARSNQMETLIGIVGDDFILLAADSSVSQSIAITSVHQDKIFGIDHLVWSASSGDQADVNRIVGYMQAYSKLYRYKENFGDDVHLVHVDDMEVLDSSQQLGERRRSKQQLGLTAFQMARFARTQIAESLRSSKPLNVNLLIAGYERIDSDSAWKGGERRTDIHVSTFSERIQKQVEQAQRGSEGLSRDMEAQKAEPHCGVVPVLYWVDEFGSCQRLRFYGAHGIGSNFLLSILDQRYRAHLTQQEAVNLVKDCFAELSKRFVVNPSSPVIKCVTKDGCIVLTDDAAA